MLALPIIAPLLAAVVCILAPGWRAVQVGAGIAGSAVVLLVGIYFTVVASTEGIQTLQVGAWPAPFGITLVADTFSGIMLAIAGAMGVVVAIYSAAAGDDRRPFHFAIYNVLILGVSGAFLTGDLFNLFVWFEVMLIASFVLLVLGGQRPQIEGGIKYVTLNLISSTFFLAAAGLLYGATGTLNMADLSIKIESHPDVNLITTIGMLLAVAFGLKAAVFPLFFWLPASYHTPPPAVSAIFSGLLTKVGVYALIRVFTLLFVGNTGLTHSMIIVVAGLTMVSGVLGALAQHEMRRILSFHIVSQIGYMLMGLGILTPLALAGSIFYIVHHIVVKTALFLVAGAILRLRGTNELERVGGLYRSAPVIAIAFALPALALAGIPPMSGFFAKLALVRAGIAAESWAIVAVALVVSLLTLLSMNKIWNEVFWKKAPDLIDQPVFTPLGRLERFGLLGPIGALILISVLISIFAGPLLEIATTAGEQLLNPAEYRAAVLGAPR